jgi:hypothetical protein
MCKLFGISRAAYYAWVKRLAHPDPDRERMNWVQEAYEKSHRIYGYRRIALWLRRQKGIYLNHKTVLRLMNKLNIRSVARKRKVFRTLAKAEIYYHYENLLNQQFHASHPNQKWVTDITYVAIQSGWAYLSTIQDLFDGFIVSHQFGRENSLLLVLRTLQLAKQTERIPKACSCTLIMATNTLHMAMQFSPNMRLLPLPCPDEAIVGIMRPWKTSSLISKKKLSANSPPRPLRRRNILLMTIFTSTTMSASN